MGIPVRPSNTCGKLSDKNDQNKMTEEELAQMMDMLQGMNQPQDQSAEESGQDTGGPPPLFPQLIPEEAENLKISLETIRKRAEYLSNASFVK